MVYEKVAQEHMTLYPKFSENCILISDFLTKFHTIFVNSPTGLNTKNDALNGGKSVSRQRNELSEHQSVGNKYKKGDSDGSLSPKKNEDVSDYDPLAVVTPMDVQSALQFRRDVEYHLNTSQHLRAMKRRRNIRSSSSLSKRKSSRSDVCSSTSFSDADFDEAIRVSAEMVWARKQNRIQPGRISTDEDVYNAMERFKILAAKTVANQYLLHPTNKSLGPMHYLSQCSTLLNMPSSEYYSRILPCCNIEEKEATLLDRKNQLKSNPAQATSLSPKQHTAEGVRRGRLPKCKNTAHLITSPNSFTHEELLRLSTMVSLLPSPEAQKEVSNSVLTYASPSILNCLDNSKHSVKDPGADEAKSDDQAAHQCKEIPTMIAQRSESGGEHRTTDNLLLSENSILSQADLVALWIRAHRNISAFRHLLHLFTIHEIETDQTVELNVSTKIASISKVNENGQNTNLNQDDVSSNTNGDKNNDINADKSDEVNESQKHNRDCAFNNEDTKAKDHTPKVEYYARFVGNHKKMRTRVEKESNLVETLIEWAISNQVLFSHHVFAKSLVRMDSRNYEENENALGNSSTPKKRRLSEGIVEITSGKLKHESVSLQQAKEAYLMRWFARRNKNIISILFSSSSQKPTNNSNALNEDLLKCLDDDILCKIKSILKRKNSTDRTLARIDRRIIVGKYLAGPGKSGTFDEAMLNLLEAMKYELNDDSPLFKHLEIAIADFIDLHLQFLGDLSHNTGKEHMRATKNAGKKLKELIQIKDQNANENELSIVEQLLSHPRPWYDKCYECNKEILDSKFSKKCWNCGVVSHSKCASAALKEQEINESKEISLDDYPIFTPLFFYPCTYLSPSVPDFILNPVKWSEINIILNRSAALANENLPSWGINMTNAEYCHESFQMISTSLYGHRVKAMPNLDNLPAIPMRIPYQGSIVQRISKNCPADKSGLLVSDVITGIKVEAFSSEGDENGKDDDVVKTNWISYNLANMTATERAKVFLQPSTKVILLVRRPQKDLVRLSCQWLHTLKKTMSESSSCLSSIMKNRWCCNDCQNSKVNHLAERDARDIKHEAKLCQALLRRLGMEWFTLPFHEEKEEIEISRREQKKRKDLRNSFGIDDDSTESDICLKPFQDVNYVSFRRIDAMMDYIIKKETSSSLFKHVKGFDNIHNDAFLLPANKGLVNNVSSERLDWASIELEEHPFELLCRSVAFVINRQNSKDNKKEQEELRQHFIELFTAWCLKLPHGTLDSNLCKHTIPLGALNAITPWVVPSCCICCICPIVAQSSSAEGICDKDECRKLYQSRKQHSSYENDWTGNNYGRGIGEKNKCLEAIRTDVLFKYNYFSGLVGSIILILPGDPIITSICKVLNSSIETLGRPLELLVASYIPHNLLTTKQLGAKGIIKQCHKVSEETRHQDGLFHIIPILSYSQLENYVLPNCDMRKYRKEVSDNSWVDLDVLRLPGIIELTPTELQTRLEETNAIRYSIDKGVASLASCLHEKEMQELQPDNFFNSHSQKLARKSLRHCTLKQSGCENHFEAQLSHVFTNLSICKSSSTIFRCNKDSTTSFHNLTDQSKVCTKYDMSEDVIEFSSIIDLVFNSECRDRFSIFTNNDFSSLLQQCDASSDTDVEDSVFEVTKEILETKSNSLSSNLNLDKDWYDDDFNKGKTVHQSTSLTPNLNSNNVIFFAESDANKSNLCQLCYTDLLYWYGQDKKRNSKSTKTNLRSNVGAMNKILSEKKFSAPSRYEESKAHETFEKHSLILHRLSSQYCKITSKKGDDSESDECDDGEWNLNSDISDDNSINSRVNIKYEGKGWGLELVRWSHEHHVTRVGRVCPNSPAFSSGLRPHDIVVAINGNSIKNLNSEKILAQALLFGSMDERQGIDYSMNPLSASILKTFKKGAAGPISLEVLRMEKIRRNVVINRTPETSAKVPNEAMQQESNTKFARTNPPSHAQHFDTNIVTNKKKVLDVNMAQPQTENRFLSGKYDDNQSASYETNHPSNDNRRDICEDDLHTGGLKGSFLSRVETAVLIEAVIRKQPLLGLRLLCPRYEIELLRSEYEKVIAPLVQKIGLSTIPKINASQWSFTIMADYRRSVNEGGPIIFEEAGYKYRLPEEKLPLDRYFEDYFKDLRENQINSYRNHLNHNLQQYNQSVQNPLTYAAINNNIHGNRQQDYMQNSGYPFAYHDSHHSEYTKDNLAARSDHNINSFSNGATFDKAIPSRDAHRETLLGSTKRNPPNASSPNIIDIADDTNDEEPLRPTKYHQDNHTGISEYFHHENANDPSHLNRIRGGGFKKVEPLVPLTRYPATAWFGIAVHGKCVAKGEEATFVGIVKNTKHDSAVYPKVLVEVIYVSNTNYLQKPITISCEAKSTFVIATNEQTKEREILNNYEAHHYGHNSNQEKGGTMAKDTTNQPSTSNVSENLGLVNSENRSDIQKVSDKNAKSNIDIKQAAYVLASRLQGKLSGSSILGLLPDGRRVHFVPSDPSSIYVSHAISKNVQSQRKYIDVLQREYRAKVKENMKLCSKHNFTPYLRLCSRGKFCCIWGCSEEIAGTPKQRTILAFDTKEQLIDHMLKYHSYSQVSSLAENSMNASNWIRIPEGIGVQTLLADLSSAICARCIFLNKKLGVFEDQRQVRQRVSCSPFKCSIIFDPKKLLKLSQDQFSGLDFNKLKNGIVKDFKVRRLLRLASRIMRLFDIEKNGLYRLKDTYFLNCGETSSNIHNQYDKKEENQLLSKIDENISNSVIKFSTRTSQDNVSSSIITCRFSNWNENTISKSIEYRQFCELCSANEEILKSKSDHCLKESGSSEQESKLRHGIGCSLLSNAVTAYSGVVGNKRSIILSSIHSFLPIQGQLDSIKLMMMQVALNIPEALFLSTLRGQRRNSYYHIARYQIWDSEFLNHWIQFLMNSSNTQMLFQALTILISSLNKNKMPKWWRAIRSGWSTPFIVNFVTMSSISLHLYILDTAITEYLVTSKSMGLSCFKKSNETKNDESSHFCELKKSRKNSYVPHELDKVSLRKRMNIIMKWAKELAVPVFQGNSYDHCLTCGDGGTLLVCEFCPNVQHAECLDPPKKVDDVTFDWICDECVKDIHIMKTSK